MAVFPTLTQRPSFPLSPDGELGDAVLSSPFEAGYEQTRPKFTRARRNFGVNYKALPDADVATLRAFELTTLRNGADSFTWTHPLSGLGYTVRLVENIKFARTTPRVADVSMTLREV